jgi:hypothetical protein
MIGYDSTNAIGQGLAAREKIYSFSYSYFLFFYRFLPSLAVNYNFYENNDLVTAVAKKIYDYFQIYVKRTEPTESTILEPQYNPALAKYYLAAIYYYEPTYNFKDSPIQDIYNLGQVYLLELFKENINYFIENSKAYLQFSVPKFSDITEEENWKFFTYAMLKADSARKFSNVIQQSTSAASRSGQGLMNYITDYLSGKDADFQAIFKQQFGTQFGTTHENKLIGEVNLANLKSAKGWTSYYESINEYVKNNWRYVYNNLIDHDDKDFNIWFNKYGNNFDNLLSLFLESINPINPLSLEEQNIRYDAVASAVFKAYYNPLKQFFVIDKDVALPDKKIKSGLILPFGVTPDVTNSFSNGAVNIITLMEDYESLLTGYKILVEEDLKKGGVPVTWEDSPNVIKCYVDEVQEFVNTSYSIKPYLPYDESFFISYYLSYALVLDDQKVSYPAGDAENSLDISAFFEFSFQPNFDRLTSKFGNILNKENFETLKNNFILNFSKTETYEFMKQTFGEENLSKLTLEEFSSLFDLNVAILHKITKKHIGSINFQDPLSSFDATSFSARRWTSNIKEDPFIRNLVFYNPLIEPNKNFIPKVAKKGESTFSLNTFECNHSINLGPTTDFGITDIRNFNPVATFQDDNKVYLFIDKIKDTKIGQFLKEKYNINPYNYPIISELLLETEVAELPETLVENNEALFIKSYSDFSKNLLDNLITNIDKVK